MTRNILYVVALSVLMSFPVIVSAQDNPIKPVSVGGNMPDFELAAIQGGSFSIAGLEGRNIMIVFPRGKVSDHWCQICHYQYAELVEFDKKHWIREKYDLEILYVLPYGSDEVQHWVDIFSSQMDVIEGWKNPPDDKKDDERVMKWAEYCRENFPVRFEFEQGKAPVPFPILVDADRKVSEGLDLFRTEWDRSAVDQNVSTVYIVDRKGVVVFKYFSQNTFDRPSPEYLLDILECMID